MPSIKLNSFGGIAPKHRSRNLPDTMATLAENVDLSNGTLKPFREPVKISDKTGETLFVEDCCIEVGDCTSEFAIHGLGCNKIVTATSVTHTPVYRPTSDCESYDCECNDDWRPLGFPCDIDAPTVSAEAHNSDFNTETRVYVYTFVNDLGWESPPSFPSEEIIVDHTQPVTVSGINGILDPVYKVEEVKIYRMMRGLDYVGEDTEQSVTDFYHVGTIPFGTVTFVDDTTTVGNVLVTLDHSPAPDDLSEVRDWRQGRLAGLSENTFVMTERNRPYAWNPRYRKAFYDTPLALVVEGKTAFIMTDGTPSRVSLTGDCEQGECLSSTEYRQSMPIVSRRSAVGYAGNAIYASSEGLVMLGVDGLQRIITDDLYTPEQWGKIHPHTMRSTVHQGVYYGATDLVTIRLELPDNARDTPAVQKLTTLSIIANDWFTDERSRLFYVDDTGTYLWGEGEDFLEMSWESKEYVSQQSVRFSAFLHVADGSGNTVTTKIRGKTLSEEEIIREKPVRFPMGYTSKYWSFKITGVNEVYEHHISTSISDLGE